MAVPYLSAIPVIGPAFFYQNVLVYLIYFVIPVAMHILIFHTRWGLDLRAVGENPAAADAAGVNVHRVRFVCVVAGASMAAGAGAYLTLAFVPSWSEGVVAGRGWIAVALVIFAGFRPINVVLASLLFGFITALGFIGQARNWPIPPAFLSDGPVSRHDHADDRADADLEPDAPDDGRAGCDCHTLLPRNTVVRADETEDRTCETACDVRRHGRDEPAGAKSPMVPSSSTTA